MRFADLDAVTVDGFGTLLELESPVPALGAALAERGIRRSHDDVAAAFAEEARYYRERAHEARDAGSLAALREACAAVFLGALHAAVEARDFVEPFLSAIVFLPAAGAVEAVKAARSRGLRLAVASNWDCSLPERLQTMGLLEHFDTVVTSAEAGAAKPAPDVLLVALERLGAEAHRALHIGDEDADLLAARAAGMHFSPAPLSQAIGGLA